MVQGGRVNLRDDAVWNLGGCHLFLVSRWPKSLAWGERGHRLPAPQSLDPLLAPLPAIAPVLAALES